MNKRHIVFDIDGTLIDTENALLLSLQDTISEITKQRIEISDLKFALGIPGEVTLNRLAIQNIAEANKIWNNNLTKYRSLISVFTGIELLLKELQKQGCPLGIITSKKRTEYTSDFMPFQLSGYFSTVICVEDSASPKPSPEPMIKYLKQTGTDAKDVLYIGDSDYDSQCAYGSGVKFGLALWGCKPAKPIRADYFLNKPQDILSLINTSSKPGINKEDRAIRKRSL